MEPCQLIRASLAEIGRAIRGAQALYHGAGDFGAGCLGKRGELRNRVLNTPERVFAVDFDRGKKGPLRAILNRVRKEAFVSGRRAVPPRRARRRYDTGVSRAGGGIVSSRQGGCQRSRDGRAKRAGKPREDSTRTRRDAPPVASHQGTALFAQGRGVSLCGRRSADMRRRGKYQ